MFDDEVPLRTKYVRSAPKIAAALQRRSLMDKEIAEIQDRIVEVVAEHGFAQVLDKDPADRTAVIEDAAIVPGTGPQLVATLGVVDERAEERRLQGLGILLEPADQILGNEFRRLLGEEDVAIDVIEHLDRDVFQPLAPHQHDNRHLEAAPAHQIDQRGGLALQPLLAPIDQHAADGRIGLHGKLGILDPARPHHLKTKLLDLGNDLLEAHPLEIVGIE